MCGFIDVLDQLDAAIHVSYRVSGTTILYVLFVLPNALMLASVGTAVAYEKSTSSSDVHPLNAFVRAFCKVVPALESFASCTVFNDVQFWNADASPCTGIEERLDMQTYCREVHP